MVESMVSMLRSSSDDAKQIYKVGQNTTRLLFAAGDLIVAWLLIRSASVAIEKLDDATASDRAFYEGKVASAKFFARQVLPHVSSELAVLEATDNSLMDIPEAAF
jgi:hypothetical protein